MLELSAEKSLKHGVSETVSANHLTINEKYLQDTSPAKGGNLLLSQ